MSVERWRHPQSAVLSWLGMLLPVLAAAVAYIAIRPPSVDLAAALFRCELFASHGFLAWNNYWYGGHYLLGYSLLFPPLGAAVGASAAGGLAAVAATALFGVLARRHYLARAQLATLWFGSGMIATLLSGRLTFALGVAIGLAALVALDSGRPSLSAPLAAATSFASPVAGFFLLLMGGGLALAGERRRGAILGLSAILPIAMMAVAFPTEGPEPFVLSSLLGTLAVTLFTLFALPRQERLLRRGTALYLGAVLAVYAVPNALGGNVVRLSNLAAAPVLTLGLAGPRRRLLLVLCAVPLLYWQWQGTVRDVSRAIADPAAHRSFYTPLIGELKAEAEGSPVRIEIPPTQDRWEVYYMGQRFLLARGWERQLEGDELRTFRDLTPGGYRDWLRAHGVSYVALPRETSFDYLARREASLVGAGLPYLKPVWSNEDWRLFAVRDATGLIQAPARLDSIGADWFDLSAPRPGDYVLRIHFNRYWTVTGAAACLRARGPWTMVEAERPGAVHVGTDLSAGALLGRHRVCSESAESAG
jgi:hypothetical protein